MRTRSHRPITHALIVITLVVAGSALLSAPDARAATCSASRTPQGTGFRWDVDIVPTPGGATRIVSRDVGTAHELIVGQVVCASFTKSTARSLFVDVISTGTSNERVTLGGARWGLGIAPVTIVIDLAGSTGVDSVTVEGTTASDTIALGLNSAGALITDLPGGATAALRRVEAASLVGSAGNDVLQGQRSGGAARIPITFIGGTGLDRITGGWGDDVLDERTTNGADLLDGGVGSDTVTYSGRTTALSVSINATAGPGGKPTDPNLFGDDGAVNEGDEVRNAEVVIGGSAGDRLVGTNRSIPERLEGGSGPDTLIGQWGNDTLVGGNGADFMSGGLGDDTFGEGDAANGPDQMIGEDGSDTVFYGGRADAGVRVTLDGVANDGAPGEGDNVRAENVAGSPLADTITGNTAANRLTGGGGADELRGSSGPDVIIGGPGADVLAGGAGIDTIDANDNEVDTSVDGGDGTSDTCTVDPGDPVIGCETVMVVDPTRSRAYGPGVESATTAEPAVFTVELNDDQGQRVVVPESLLVVGVSGPRGAVPVAVTDNLDGTYTVTYQAVDAGAHRVDVSWDGVAIQGSPALVNVAEAASPTLTQVSGPGVDGVVRDTVPASFTIVAYGTSGRPMARGGEPFDVRVSGPQGAVPVQFDDNGDGTYTVSYAANEPGQHTVSVTLRGTPVAASPYLVDVRAGASEQSVASGTGVTGPLVLGEPATVTIQAYDRRGLPMSVGGDAFELRVQGPRGEVATTLVDNGDGTYTGSYTPTAAGIQAVTVRVNGGDIVGSPAQLRAPGVDPSRSRAYGPGLELPTTGAPAVFTVELNDDQGNRAVVPDSLLVVTVLGPRGAVPVAVTDNLDGTYTATYQPVDPGPHRVDVSWDSVAIQGSPFSPRVAG